MAFKSFKTDASFFKSSKTLTTSIRAEALGTAPTPSRKMAATCEKGSAEPRTFSVSRKRARAHYLFPTTKKRTLAGPSAPTSIRPLPQKLLPRREHRDRLPALNLRERFTLTT